MVGTLLRMAAKGLIGEKVMKKIVITLGDLLVKSTKNVLYDIVSAQVKQVLEGSNWSLVRT